jgi:hypothetical protein
LLVLGHLSLHHRNRVHVVRVVADSVQIVNRFRLPLVLFMQQSGQSRALDSLEAFSLTLSNEPIADSGH